MSDFRPSKGADSLSEYELERASLVEEFERIAGVDPRDFTAADLARLNDDLDEAEAAEPEEYDPPCLPDEHMPREVHLVAKVCDRCGTITEQAVVISA